MLTIRHNAGLSVVARQSFINGIIERVNKSGATVVALKAGGITADEFRAAMHKAGHFTALQKDGKITVARKAA